MYQGDRLLLRVKACGVGRKYEWALFEPDDEKSAYLPLFCFGPTCAIETADFPEGDYYVHVAVTNEEGAAFTVLSFHVMPRPEKSVEAASVRPALVYAYQPAPMNLRGLKGILTNDSDYGAGVRQLALGQTATARILLNYSLWTEPQHRDQAKAALNEIIRQERWKITLHLGLFADSNFLRQGATPTTTEVSNTPATPPPRSRIAYQLVPALSAHVFRSEQYDTSFQIALDRKTNFKLLLPYGMEIGDKTLAEYDQSRFDVSVRQSFFNSDNWDRASLRLAIEPFGSKQQTGTSTVDSGRGLKIEIASPILQGSPALSVVTEHHQDSDSQKATPFDPVTGEIHPWTNHSGQLRQVGLDLNLWRQNLSQIVGTWQQETWKHEASDAKVGDYNALRFIMDGRFRIGLKQLIAAKVSLEGRLHSESIDARLDKKTSISGAWIWYPYPNLSRSFIVNSESNQSNRVSAQYQRIVVMFRISFEI